MEIKPSDIIEYIIGIVNDFADYVGLTEHQAFFYLKTHNAIPFLERHYGVMHTLDTKENIESLIKFCRKNGGKL